MTRQSTPLTRLGGRPRRCDAAATRTLQRTLLAPGQARAFVDEQLCPLHGPNAIAAVRLVASEVVLHAVRYGEGPVVISPFSIDTRSRMPVMPWPAPGVRLVS